MLYLLPVGAALLLHFSICPGGFNWLAWVSFIPLLFFLKYFKLTRFNFSALFIFGTVFFTVNLSWLLVLKEWAGVSIYAGLPGLAFYLGIFYLPAVVLTYMFYRKLRPGLFLMAAPAVWVVFEWLRGIGPFGLTLGNWALGQYQNLFLLKIASGAGIYGLDFLIVFMNVLGFLAIEELFAKKWNLFPFSLAGLYLVLLIIFQFGDGFFPGPLKTGVSPGALTIRAAGIQPNIGQKDKLNYLKLEDNFNIQIQQCREVQASARKSGAGLDLIVWPESLPWVLDPTSSYFKRLAALAREFNCGLLVGAFTQSKTLHNSALLFSGDGRLSDVYRKHQPVPFGEYLPFRFIFYHFLKKSGLFERDQSPAPLKTLAWGGAKIGAAICFESSFSSISRKLANLGAEVFFVLTNDAWFKQTDGARYHFMFLPFRAAETGRCFFQVANTGISGVVGSDGRILSQTRLNSKEILTASMPLLTPLTLYDRFGDWVVEWSFVVIVGICIFLIVQSLKLKIKKI